MRRDQARGGDLRSVEVSPRNTAKDGPHFLVKFKKGRAISHTQQRFALGGIHNTIVNWIYNGNLPGRGEEGEAVGVEDEPGPATNADSAPTTGITPKGGEEA